MSSLSPVIDPPTIFGNPPPQLVETRRGAVECAVAGDGPAVLALHGALGGYDQSLILARVLGAPGLRYLALSRPGYLGTSLAVGRTPEEQADAYRDVLDALGIEREREGTLFKILTYHLPTSSSAQ